MPNSRAVGRIASRLATRSGERYASTGESLSVLLNHCIE